MLPKTCGCEEKNGQLLIYSDCRREALSGLNR
ncbi:hypothetical protein CEXT_644521, partial [Caerostris extrusa]